MDLLTHLFLPLTVAYVLRPDLFPTPWHLAVTVAAIAPDFDKLLGLQGTFHSLVTLGLVSALIVGVERWYRDEISYSVLIGALLFSHLLLDLLDGGPVLFLYPLSETGIGLTYPTTLVLGQGITEVGVQQPLPNVHTTIPNRDRTTYSLITGYGVLSCLTFLTVYLSKKGFDFNTN